MFWKSKPTDPVKIETKSRAEKRQAFRINPESEHPVTLTVGTDEIYAANISSGGVAFRADGFQAGKRYSVRLQLPGNTPPIHTKIEVIEIDERQVCRCRFIGLSALSQESVHRYVLDREKAQIRTTRMRRVITDADIEAPDQE